MFYKSLQGWIASNAQGTEQENTDSGGAPLQDLTAEILQIGKGDRIISGENKIEEPRILDSTEVNENPAPLVVEDIFQPTQEQIDRFAMYDAAAAVNAAHMLKMSGKKLESGTSSSDGTGSGPKSGSGPQQQPMVDTMQQQQEQ